MSKDELMHQTIGELKEGIKHIAQNTEAIKDNLRVLNDNNVLHDKKAEARQGRIMQMLETISKKHWWIIMIVVITLALIALGERLAPLLLKIFPVL